MSHTANYFRFLVSSLFAICLSAAAARANGGTDPWEQIRVPTFSHLTQAEGLPYPIALNMAQDSQGFIWIGTPGGLARWDGHQMRVYRHDSADPHSLPENIVLLVHAGEQGRIWLTTASGMVASYDPATDHFTSYPDPSGGIGGPTALAGDGLGGIWLAGHSGLKRLTVASGSGGRSRSPAMSPACCATAPDGSGSAALSGSCGNPPPARRSSRPPSISTGMSPPRCSRTRPAPSGSEPGPGGSAE